MIALGIKALLDNISDGGFAGTRQAGKPEHGRCLALNTSAGAFINIDRLPMNVFGTAQAEINHAHANRIIGQAVNQNKRTHRFVGRIGVKGNRLTQGQVAHPQFVEIERSSGIMG